MPSSYALASYCGNASSSTTKLAKLVTIAPSVKLMITTQDAPYTA